MINGVNAKLERWQEALEFKGFTIMHSPFLFTIVAKDLSDPLFKAKNAKSDRIGEVSGEMVVATIGNYIL